MKNSLLSLFILLALPCISRAEITSAYQPVYLVGDIIGVDDNPEYALEGYMTEDGDPTIIWSSIHFQDNYHFRFVTEKAAYSDIASGASSGEILYPADGDEECNNIWLNRSGNWYTATEGKSSDNYWVPAVREENQHYEIFYNLATNRISIGWSEMTEVDDVVVATGDEPVDVYSLQGIRLRRSVDPRSASDDLPRGLYIIGGRKVAVR